MGADPSAAARRFQLPGVWLVAFGAAIWGFDGPLRAPLTGSLSAATIVFYEHLFLSAALLVPALRGRDQWRRFGRLQWAAVLWIAWGGSALGTVCFTEAIRLGNPTSAVFVLKLQPLLAVLLARLLLRESEITQPGYWVRLGVALTAAYGVSAESLSGWGGLWNAEVQSALLALSAAAIWASCTVAGRYMALSVSAGVFTALRALLALPFLAALLAAAPAQSGFAAGFQHLPPLAGLGLIPGAAGLLVYYHGLRSSTASLAALGEMCFPASAALLNWVFLGVSVTPLQLFWAGVLWTAVLWPAPKQAGFARAQRADARPAGTRLH